MAIVYRDYGSTSSVSFPNNQFNITPHGQVYLATHDGEGNSLPFMTRSFISFTFGGKKIEDFNLISTISGDRLDRAGYASFNDIISEYNNLDGQSYWNTHYSANELSFTLATDGIDQRSLDEFLYWFRAGETKELILAEHPNRAILARVKDAPQLNLLPFEGPIIIKIDNTEYNTSTTLYKGEINLTFVMDQPFWYSLTNVLGKLEGNFYTDVWIDEKNHEIPIQSSPDALKILYEDGIPLGSMIQSNLLLGNGTYAKVEDNTESLIWNSNLTTIDNIEDLMGAGACIDGTVNGITYRGRLAGAIIENNGTLILPANANGYFYYAGTAPAYTIIRFNLGISFDNNGYFNSIANNYSLLNNKNYNTITIESEHTQELRLTTPNICTSYNKVISIFKNSTDKSWEEICSMIRDDVRHAGVRSYTNTIIDANKQNTTTATSSKLSLLVGEMQHFFDGSATMEFEFNSETGEAWGIFTYKTTSNTTKVNQKENVGDMLCSNYLIIRDRNYPTANNAIVAWSNTNKRASHRIKHNFRADLTQLSLYYKNMYL